MSPKKGTRESAKRTTASGQKSKGFTAEERAAMKERIQELKADKADGESAVLAKIAEMPEPDRAMGERLHAIIKASVPALADYLVRDARVCQEWQGRLLLPKRAEVQGEVRHARFQRRGEPRRRRHVADGLRAEGADRRRRGTDRRAPEESGELRRVSFRLELYGHGTRLGSGYCGFDLSQPWSDQTVQGDV
jgi:hypothetical protein